MSNAVVKLNKTEHNSTNESPGFSWPERILTAIALLVIAAIIIYSIAVSNQNRGETVIYLANESDDRFAQSDLYDNNGLKLAENTDYQSSEAEIPDEASSKASDKISNESVAAYSQDNNVSEIETDFPININTAAAEELTRLPGIGEVKAAAIVNYRETYGDFINIDELTEVKGIGEKTLEKLRDMVTLG